MMKNTTIIQELQILDNGSVRPNIHKAVQKEADRLGVGVKFIEYGLYNTRWVYRANYGNTSKTMTGVSQQEGIAACRIVAEEASLTYYDKRGRLAVK